MGKRKYDKQMRAMPGFKSDPAALRRLSHEREERGEKKRIKAAAKRLRAEGFEFDNLVKHAERFTK